VPTKQISQIKTLKSSDEILKFLRDHFEEYKIRYQVKSLGLFGSYSRGDQTEESDIDVLVEFEQPIGLKFCTFANELEHGLNSKVDLVSKKAIKPKYWTFIENEVRYV